jgi:hypothetical protein
MFDGNGMLRGRAVRLFQQPGDAIALPSPYDAIVGVKIGQGPRNASPCDIAGRPNDHHVMDSNLTGNQVGRVVKIADPHREVDVLADKVDPPVGEAYVEMQRRIAFSHVEQHRHYIQPAERRRQIDPHFATWSVSSEHECALAAIEFGECRNAMLEPSLTGRRQDQTTCRSVQQLGTQPGLKPRHRSSDRGLGHAKLHRDRGETSQSRHGDEFGDPSKRVSICSL